MLTPTSLIAPNSEPSRPGNPSWYGRRYPSEDDLVIHAEALGALVIWHRGAVAAFHPETEDHAAAILVPTAAGPLWRVWMLAHELGHLAQHSGPRGQLLYTKDETAADRWAAKALIPEAAVRRYRNASLDAFVGALWKHYETFPLEDCPVRALAGRIARVRLRALEVAS